MEKYQLSPFYRKIVGRFYKSTFILLAVYLVCFLFSVFAVIQGWLGQEDQIIEIGGYVLGAPILICILAMGFYALSYVWFLWQKGYRQEALQGLMTVFILNILTGYLWFYWAEIKRQEIRLKLI